MCTGSDTSNPLKNPLYWLIKQDSRGAAELGRATGWDFLRDEGKHNQENPGRALGKAATSAALWYLGGPAAASGAESAGGQVAMQAAGDAEQELANQAIQQAMQQGAQQSAMQLAEQIPQGYANTMESALIDTGYTPSSLRGLLTNGPGSGNMPQAMMNYTKNAATSDVAKKLAVRQGLGLLSQPQQPRPQPPPMYRAPERAEPVIPYGGDLTDEERRRRRMMGYSIY